MDESFFAYVFANNILEDTFIDNFPNLLGPTCVVRTLSNFYDGVKIR